MKARTLGTGLAVLLAAAGGAWWLLRPGDGPDTWRTAQVERKDIAATVSATGALDAVTTVEVGTQVTGVITELLADSNDTVRRGQVIARIDTAVLEVEDARTTHDVAQARVRSSRVALDRASRNLAHATITAPVDGVVVERDVDVGQTVNAGMSAPRLVLIAGDLARMQILASVDEADIGRIQAGQEVDFITERVSDVLCAPTAALVARLTGWTSSTPCATSSPT